MSHTSQQLEKLITTPSAIAWFRGLFNRIHIEMTDSGERYTIVHAGDAMELYDDFGPEEPNFVVPLRAENIDNLIGFFADDAIDAHEEYRIVKFMLVPCLKAALAMPILQNRAFLKIVRVDTHWQEALLDPAGNEDERVTVIHVNDQWLVVPGYHGRPQRRMVMTPAQVLDFQRRVLHADSAGSLAAWLELGSWYVRWREAVTV
jgi:hypothetical protein